MTHNPVSWWIDDGHFGPCMTRHIDCRLVRRFITLCSCGDAVSVRAQVDDGPSLDRFDEMVLEQIARHGKLHYGRDVYDELEEIPHDASKDQPAHSAGQ